MKDQMSTLEFFDGKALNRNEMRPCLPDVEPAKIDKSEENDNI